MSASARPRSRTASASRGRQFHGLVEIGKFFFSGSFWRSARNRSALTAMAGSSALSAMALSSAVKDFLDLAAARRASSTGRSREERLGLFGVELHGPFQIGQGELAATCESPPGKRCGKQVGGPSRWPAGSTSEDSSLLAHSMSFLSSPFWTALSTKRTTSPRSAIVSAGEFGFGGLVQTRPGPCRGKDLAGRKQARRKPSTMTERRRIV